MTLLVGALLAAAAVLVLPPGPRPVAVVALQRVAAERAALGDVAPAAGRVEHRRRPRGPGSSRRLRSVGVGAVCLVAALVGSAQAGAPGGIAVVATVLTAVWWRRRRRAAQVARRSAATGQACLGMAGELAAGSTPAAALQTAAGEWPELLGPAAGRAAIGGDVARELRAAADAPGAGALHAVAAAWALSERTGARLADTLTVVADSLRVEDGIRREAAASLAGAHVTARTLAVLPGLTLLGTSAGGAEPWRFLLGTPAGGVCLVVAGILIVAGLSWVSHVSRRATASRWER